MLDKKITHRIKIIQGHMKAIEKMLESDSYCIDILYQSKAVQSALKKLDMQILTDHLNNCVVEQIQDGKEQKAIKELIDLYKVS